MTGAVIAGSVASGLSSRKASKDAQKAADREAAMSAEQMRKAIGAIEGNQANINAFKEFLKQRGEDGTQFAQGLMDEWEGTFGAVEENLSNYYNNLDPTKYATESKANFKAQMDKQMSQFNETMASQGLQSAGMKQQAAKEAAFKTAEANSQIDLAAEDKVMGMKADFWNAGENRRARNDGLMVDMFNQNTSLGGKAFDLQTGQSDKLANIYSNGALFSQGRADKFGQSAAGHSQSANSAFGSALGAGINASGGIGIGGNKLGSNNPFIDPIGMGF